jgi:Putative Na+/H+ antiporter
MLSHSLQTVGTGLFFLAILHILITPWLKKYSEKYFKINSLPAILGHLLSEIELVFGFWAIIFISCIWANDGFITSVNYLSSRSFTEPLFVFVIMVISATRPILQIVLSTVLWISRTVPLVNGVVFYCTALSLLPILGSWITEPAAMTIAALLLSQQLFQQNISTKLKYATLGILFVNISIGGTFTTFAAPPIVMVAQKWQWDTSFMMATFAWKATIAIILNTLIATVFFYKELCTIKMIDTQHNEIHKTPILLVLIHILLLAAVVFFAHQPVWLVGILVVFLILTYVSSKYQQRLMIREGLFVAFFLAGLIVLGEPQRHWLQPILSNSSDNQLFLGGIILTAFIDNAALTYLASLIDNLSDTAQYALVAGAVTGGGLTVIANAPNPAGAAILKQHFPNYTIQPFKLLIAALIPTVIATMAFYYL